MAGSVVPDFTACHPERSEGPWCLHALPMLLPHRETKVPYSVRDDA